MLITSSNMMIRAANREKKEPEKKRVSIVSARAE